MAPTRRTRVADALHRHDLGEAPVAAPLAAPRRASGGRPPAPAATRRAPQAARAPAPADEPAEDMQLPLGAIVLSLPIAIAVGDMIVTTSLEPLPQALAWAGALALWQTVSAEPFRQGTADFMVDALNLPPVWRQRLGVSDRPAVTRPRARGFVGGVVADIAAWRGAVDARRGVDVPATAAQPGQAAAEDAAWAPVGQRHTPERTAQAGGGRLAAIDEELDGGRAEERIPGLPVVRLEDAARVMNLWVVGPKNSGKTTVLRTLIGLRRGAHVALDPHSTPGKWPGCTVVGGGRNFGAIDTAIGKAVGRMDARYKAMDRGEVTEAECQASPYTLVGDEWMSITEALPGRRAARGEEAEPAAADRLLTLLTEGRKAGLYVLAASHADTATAMGLSGKKDVLKCFDLVIYLGSMATKYVPEAVAMERPAVVYDPERDAFAQLVIGEVAPAAVPAPRAEAVGGEVAAPPARRPTPGGLALDAAELAELQRAQASSRPTPATRAPGPARVADDDEDEPLPANVIRLADRRAPAPAPNADDLLAALVASAPTAKAAPASDLDARIKAALARASVPPPASPAQSSVTVDQPGGGQVIVNVQQTAAGRGGSGRRRPAAMRPKLQTPLDQSYQAARLIVARGGSANDIQRELRIKRATAQEYARRASSELPREP